MVIKPQKSTTFGWLIMLTILPFAIYSELKWDIQLIAVDIILLCGLVLIFTKAFSTYYLDYMGITQRCLFITRHFDWEEFKFIRWQIMACGSATMPYKVIRCSTEALPKNLTDKKIFEKLYWPPSKTITIEWPNKGGEAFYQEFLSYCGGERDIRE